MFGLGDQLYLTNPFPTFTNIPRTLINGITLVLRETDSYSRLILISERTKYTSLVRNNYLGLVK
jgi:hypothetical protein